MWTAILRAFAPLNPKQISDLLPLREYRLTATDLSASKQWLSELICCHRLPRETFYRFEAAPGGPKLVISFYLFEDRRICPLRIWNRTELYGHRSAGPEWMADFNGLPPWSVIAAAEPQWRLVAAPARHNSTVGRSARDWRKRDCWAVELPDPALAPAPVDLAS
jgi:hypothetical protein